MNMAARDRSAACRPPSSQFLVALWEQHARCELVRGVEGLFDPSHLLDPLVAVELPQQSLLQGLRPTPCSAAGSRLTG